MNLLESFFEFYQDHKGGINGAATGLLIAILILAFGFFRMLFVFIFMGIGYFVGKRLYEDRNYLKNLLDRILPPGTYR